MKTFLSASRLFETNKRIREMVPIKQNINNARKNDGIQFMFKGKMYPEFAGTTLEKYLPR